MNHLSAPCSTVRTWRRVSTACACRFAAVLLAFLAQAVWAQPASLERWQEPAEAAGVRWGVPPDFSREKPDTIPRRWTRRLTGYLPARDGVLLRYSLLLPAGNGPFPVLINYSGYDPGAIGGFSYEHDNTAMSTEVEGSLLEHGYAVLGVNARGTGCSEGSFDFLGPAYGSDGADIVEWAAAQPWSTGAVGMFAWSWAGMSQVATASNRPAHLKAIAPGMALTDPRLDSWEIGGVPSQGFLTGWWMFLHSRWLAVRRSAQAEGDERCLRQVELNYEQGETAPLNLPSLLIRHPLRDAWIDAHTLLGSTDHIQVPVLSIEAFQDEATTARAGYYQERLDPSRLWYIQTNGDHDLYESRRLRPILLAFFDHFVKGLRNGFEKRPHVEIWQETTSVMDQGRQVLDRQAHPSWVIQRPAYPVVPSLLRLHLADGHRLAFEAPAADAPAAPADTYHYPVEGPTIDLDPGDGGRWGELAAGWKSGSLAFTSDPLTGDTVIYGPASADLWISSTEADTDLQVTLTEVRPDGQERFVQRGWLRVSDRAQDAGRSTPTRPWPCDRPDCIQALAPEAPVLARVELTKVSYAFRKGSRLRLWIDAPSATGENSFSHASLPSINRIWHDAAHPSQLVMGVLPDVPVPPAAIPCAAVLMQPCRPNPLAGP